MNFFKISIATLLAMLFSLSIFAHDPKGESFTLSGKITSVELTDGGGTITVSSEAGRYGKVFLTYTAFERVLVPDHRCKNHEEV